MSVRVEYGATNRRLANHSDEGYYGSAADSKFSEISDAVGECCLNGGFQARDGRPLPAVVSNDTPKVVLRCSGPRLSLDGKGLPPCHAPRR